ncbi:MAG: D-glycero-beta-D-manno-heptose 1-phosphate adenylyltransferase [bacterium]
MFSGIKNLKTKNVLIIGDVMIDEYFFGNVDRISPEAPVVVVKKEKTEWSLGGAANVASNCKKIGLEVDLIGVINDKDLSGQKLISLLNEKNISQEGLVKTNQRNTICKNRVMAGHHQLLRLDTENNSLISGDLQNQIIEKFNNLIKPDSVILISDYAKGIVTPILLEKIIKKAREKKCLILVDPKGPDFDKYCCVNYLKPNAKEFKALINFFKLNSDDSIVINGRKICDILQLTGLFVTLGEKGIQFISKTDSIFIPANKKEVYDLTGAGDTVFSFLGFGFAASLPIEKTLTLANLAASIAISHLKTYSVGLDEVLEELKEERSKIIDDWEELKNKIDQLKKQNKKIVFTNGSFDILHVGHIFSLQEAKKQGAVLVVALNTDDSVKRYKGVTRPINPLSDRAKLMEAIEVVDFVTSFDQDTPAELIQFLKPDVLVKGGDYKIEDVAGGEFVISQGGRVHIVNYQKGYSTTNLINIMSDKAAIKQKHV